MNKISVEVLGTSHSEKVSVKINGLPVGASVDVKKLQAFVNRRKASNSNFSTKRIEPDKIIIERGIKSNEITGEVVASIENKNTKSSDYDELKYIPRPSHADYGAMLKYGIDYDLTGGGEFSGRMTAPLCIAGGIVKQLLQRRHIEIFAYVSSVGGIKCTSYEDKNFTTEELEEVAKKKLPVFSNEEEIVELFNKCAKNKDSVGGTIDCVIRGLKGGIGGNLFNGIEGKLSSYIFGVPSVKAVEFGIGTKFSDSFASDVNDGYRVEDGAVKLESNNNGGIVGGISTGEDILIRATLKPTPSISQMQHSVNMKTMENVNIEIKGRHDVCHTIRAVAPIESVVAIGLWNLLSEV